MGNYIVKKGNEFFVGDYKTVPANSIILPHYYINVDTIIKYKFVDKSIEFIWKAYMLKIRYKDQLIDSYKTENLQQVCDFLNKYNQMSQQEIEKLYLESQTQIKSELEQEIETLQEEKQKLEEEVYLYRQIKAKREELNNLLVKLEENTQENQ
jgi:hypothetical protein